jgi:hypothetical protein
MEEETKVVIAHLKANIETLQSDNATDVEQAVALEQAEYHATEANEMFKSNH